MAQAQLLIPSSLEKSQTQGQVQTDTQDYSSLIELIKDLRKTVVDLQKMIENQNLRIADYEGREKIKRVEYKNVHERSIPVASVLDVNEGFFLGIS